MAWSTRLMPFLVAVSARMTLSNIEYPLGSIIDRSPSLREQGDILNPFLEGANILNCGAYGNNYPNQQGRFAIDATTEAGRKFKVKGLTHMLENGRGQISFRLKYGPNPNFKKNGYFILDQYTQESAPNSWTFPSLIKADQAYNAQATIEVTLTDGDSQSGNTTQIYVQCIDLLVTGGRELPSDYDTPNYSGLPGTFDPNANKPDWDTGVGIRSAAPALGNNQWDIWQILVVIGLVLLCIAAICLLCCIFKPGKDKQEPEPLAADLVQRDIEEQPVAAAAVAPAPVRAVSLPEPEYAPPEFSSLEDSESEEDEDMAGSKGRHFHFRYIDYN